MVRLVIKDLAPSVHAGLFRVIEAWSVLPMPVDAFDHCQIETHQEEPGGAELHGQVHGSETGIIAPPDMPRPVEQKRGRTGHTVDVVELRALVGHAPVSAQLQTLEAGDTVMDAPPGAV